MTRIYGSFDKVDDQLIDEFEANFKVKLPKDYRDFLVEHNGGYPDPNSFAYSLPGSGTWIGGVNRFYGITKDDHPHSLAKNAKMWRQALPANLLPIADNGGGNAICISVVGETVGHMYFFLHDQPETESIVLIAGSFSTFLSGLTNIADPDDE